MSKSVAQQIIDNLQDNSFPSIQLLTGKWGCGKTHFAKCKIVPILEKDYEQAHYISLYGVSSLDDFRDKIVSLSYFNSKNSINSYSMVKNVVGNVAKGFGDKGATLAIANSLAKPMKHKLLSKISHCAFVIDDLERVSSQALTSEVLGECLNLVENNVNVAILVLANEEHIEDKSILEKTFNDKTVLAASSDEMIAVIREQYGRHLDDVTTASAKKIISKLEISNYRIVLRAMQRFVPIKAQIEKIQGVDKETALSNVINQVFAITYAHYEYGASFDEICKESAREPLDGMEAPSSGERVAKEEETPEDKLARVRLESIRRSIQGSTGNVPPALVSYCLNITPIPIELVEAFNLPRQGKLLDRIKSFNIYDLSDSQFDQAIMEAKEFLFGNTAELKHFYEWFVVLDSYFFFIENMYIQEDINNEYEKAKAVIETLKAFQPASFNRSYEMHLRNRHPKVHKLYKIAKPLNDELAIDIKQRTLKKGFLASWSTASSEIYDKYETKPFLHLFDAEEVCQAFKNWQGADIIAFGRFIENRYIVGAVREYLEDEFEFVRQLKAHLELKIPSMSASRLKGCVNLLATDYLEKGIKCIEKAESYSQVEYR